MVRETFGEPLTPVVPTAMGSEGHYMLTSSSHPPPPPPPPPKCFPYAPTSPAHDVCFFWEYMKVADNDFAYDLSNPSLYKFSAEIHINLGPLFNSVEVSLFDIIECGLVELINSNVLA